MTNFARFEAIAAPLPLAHVDTDKILPARFLVTVSREGMARGLFHDLKRDPGFILNRAPWNAAGIIVARENFGCGSSREHAPWALHDFGIRCLIAPSFADIFYNNCFRNGILPICLVDAEIEILLSISSVAASAKLVVDLERQTVETTDGRIFDFAIDPARKRRLAKGSDDIAHSLERVADIEAFEAAQDLREPWLRRIRYEDAFLAGATT